MGKVQQVVKSVFDATMPVPEIQEVQEFSEVIQIIQSKGAVENNLIENFGSLSFSLIAEKVQHHFLNASSELRDPAHPEWIIKYLKDQLETVKIRCNQDRIIASSIFGLYLQTIIG